MKSPLSRRALLRGAGGVAIAMPFLDAMAPRKASAATASKKYFSFLNENGVVPQAFFPTGTEKDFKLGPLLAPLAFCQQNLIIPDGLDNKASGGTCHAAARCGTLTGASNNGGRARGPSIDAVIADKISAGTRLKAIYASVYLKNNFIYSLYHSGPGQMIQPIDDPAMVFAALFSAGVPSPAAGPGMNPAAQAEFAAVRARKKSVLDRAMEEYRRVHGSLGVADQNRLNRHMDGIREIERGLEAISTGGGGAAASCKMPTMEPGADFPTHTKLQTDMLVMALACDITRVANIQTRASLTSFTWLGVNTGQHALSHQQGSAGADAQLNKIQLWFGEQVAYLIKALQSTQDSDGQTLFDNTLLFWANDLGRGTHARQRYPFVLATGKFQMADGKLLETGRYLKYPGGTTHNGLLTSIGRIMGLPLTDFGDGGLSKGPLPGLG